MAKRAPRMGKHVGPEPQACVRDATSCEQLGAADGSFSRATRLGPSPNALWMGQKEASVQVTGSGYPRGGLARWADKGIGSTSRTVCEVTPSWLRQAIPEGSRAPRRAKPREVARWCARCKRAFEMRRLASSGGTANGSSSTAAALEPPRPCERARGEDECADKVANGPHGERAKYTQSQKACATGATCLLCCAAAGRPLGRRAALPDPKVWAAPLPARGDRQAARAALGRWGTAPQI